MLISFIDDLRNRDTDVTVELLSLETFKMDPNFFDGVMHKIRQWMYAFLKRNGYSIREKTHVAQKEINLEEAMDFVVSINETNSNFNIPADYILNMDETPLYNDNKPKKTVTYKGILLNYINNKALKVLMEEKQELVIIGAQFF